MVMVESAVTLGAAFSICFLTPPLFLGGAVSGVRADGALPCLLTSLAGMPWWLGVTVGKTKIFWTVPLTAV